MKKQYILLTLILLLIVIVVIGRNLPEHYFSKPLECITSSSSVSSSDMLSSAYQKVLRDSIRSDNPDDYRYFFQSFVDTLDRAYMVTNFRNKNVCFDIKLLVTNWDKLAGMRANNGEAYPKELYDVTWSIDTIDAREEVVYHNMRAIID